jgi:hypothetical protein
MIDRRQVPGKIMPGTPLPRTGSACDFDPQHLLQVFGEHREPCWIDADGESLRQPNRTACSARSRRFKGRTGAQA